MKVKGMLYFWVVADYFVPLKLKAKSAKMVYQVEVPDYKGQRVTVDLCETEEQFKRLTVSDLKRKIFQQINPTCREDEVYLKFDDKPLDEDSKLLSDYGIRHMSEIQLCIFQFMLCSAEINMGDRDHKNQSMECLKEFEVPSPEPKSSCVLL